MKAKCLSPDEIPVSLIVSLSNIACAYAYKRTIAALYIFLL